MEEEMFVDIIKKEVETEYSRVFRQRRKKIFMILE
jgi:hypothetical protein